MYGRIFLLNYNNHINININIRISEKPERTYDKLMSLETPQETGLIRLGVHLIFKSEHNFLHSVSFCARNNKKSSSIIDFVIQFNFPNSYLGGKKKRP